MTESYELPVLFTDDECKAYAAWGMKKEKVLMPFALITILIYMVATVLVVMKVWGVRESDHLLFQMLLWGDWIPELTGALAVFMTILLLGPLNFILDKLWKKPAEPMCLCVVPEGGTDGTGNLFKPGGQHDLLSEEMVSDRGKYHRKYLSAGKTASMDGSPGK